MSASLSSSTSRPIDTTSRRPRPIGFTCGRDLALAGRGAFQPPFEAQHARDREAPDVGVEHADREALRGECGGQVDGDRRLADARPCPRRWSALSSSGGTAVVGAFSRTFHRALAMAADFSSPVSSVQRRSTSVTPGSDPTRALTSRWSWARSGQPEVVSAMVTTTAPSGEISAPLAMPSSTMSLPSSGSTTPRSSAITSSEVGGVGGPAGELWAVSGTARILPGSAV